MAERRSPLKQKPLRVPGQSTDEEISRLEYDELAWYLSLSLMITVITISTWLTWLAKEPSNPTLISIMCVIIVSYSTFRIIKARKKIKLLKLGRNGERMVAEFLDELREDGMPIFHDIQGDSFNLDHVIISKHGIFVIETKTRSKFSDSKVFYDGKVLLVDGMRPDRDPLVQAAAEARWIREQLQASTGKKFPVRPVVVFPGWYVEPMKEARRSEVWVLNPKAVPEFVRHEPQQISEEDVRLAAYHLACMVRSGG